MEAHKELGQEQFHRRPSKSWMYVRNRRPVWWKGGRKPGHRKEVSKYRRDTGPGQIRLDSAGHRKEFRLFWMQWEAIKIQLEEKRYYLINVFYRALWLLYGKKMDWELSRIKNRSGQATWGAVLCQLQCLIRQRCSREWMSGLDHCRAYRKIVSCQCFPSWLWLCVPSPLSPMACDLFWKCLKRIFWKFLIHLRPRFPISSLQKSSSCPCNILSSLTSFLATVLHFCEQKTASCFWQKKKKNAGSAPTRNGKGQEFWWGLSSPFQEAGCWPYL